MGIIVGITLSGSVPGGDVGSLSLMSSALCNED
jgi:hypothetical protein